DRVKRREFITLVGAAAIAWPFVARAQPPAKIPRIGIIDDSPMWNAFRHGLRDLGYLEGQNIAFEYRYAGGLPDRVPDSYRALPGQEAISLETPSLARRSPANGCSSSRRLFLPSRVWPFFGIQIMPPIPPSSQRCEGR